ncbi:hypothetical protein TRFO_37855 [Tritrichomonas foetus]|uniref:Uncharacterized protein n=1 Tax=Tritrichomonas foetus TaxID=1144522 RepID=A0A1J4JCK6_9EUKA|nr:hypothetical protein TRFO_37855 [Tritrichomonas foetus]|eukprot:OHS95991.1 hypothetical protein TRFO_37855 [Tritrichomonas foetus]
MFHFVFAFILYYSNQYENPHTTVFEKNLALEIEALDSKITEIEKHKEKGDLFTWSSSGISSLKAIFNKMKYVKNHDDYLQIFPSSPFSGLPIHIESNFAPFFGESKTSLFRFCDAFEDSFTPFPAEYLSLLQRDSTMNPPTKKCKINITQEEYKNNQNDVKKAFQSNYANFGYPMTLKKLQPGEIICRVQDPSGFYVPGNYWYRTRDIPTSLEDIRLKFAVLPQWNQLGTLIIYVVPPNTDFYIFEGVTSAQQLMINCGKTLKYINNDGLTIEVEKGNESKYFLPGGGNQIFVIPTGDNEYASDVLKGTFITLEMGIPTEIELMKRAKTSFNNK